MKRKLLSSLLAALLLTTALLIPAGAADPFSDVSSSDPYYDAVLWALDQGVTTGTSATTFSPDRTCTRGQVVTFLWRAVGRPDPVTAENPFRDVAARSYCEKPVLWAVEQGITNGTSAAAFSPEQTCSHAQILTFLWRAAGCPQADGTGTVAARFPESYYSDALRWAEALSLLQNGGRGFRIDAPCSRAQTVTYLYSALSDTLWNPFIMQRQVILDYNAMCGVILVGIFPERGENDMIYERSFWDQALKDSGLTEDYEFLRSLPVDNIIQTPGGHELYLIIPLDENASVAVNQWIIREENGYRGETGQVLYRSDCGAPVLLCCNRRDDMPDAQVVIVDSQGRTLDWTPGLSLENGRIDTRAKEGPRVYDMTQYPD